jgi:hypothetical protein
MVTVAAHTTSTARATAPADVEIITFLFMVSPVFPDPNDRLVFPSSIPFGRSLGELAERAVTLLLRRTSM